MLVLEFRCRRLANEGAQVCDWDGVTCVSSIQSHRKSLARGVGGKVAMAFHMSLFDESSHGYPRQGVRGIFYMILSGAMSGF
jgi:hypothetical protein